MKNDIFHCLVEERNQERQKQGGGGILLLDPPFFILTIWEENDKGKVLKDALYTNTLNLNCDDTRKIYNSLLVHDGSS